MHSANKQSMLYSSGMRYQVCCELDDLDEVAFELLQVLIAAVLCEHLLDLTTKDKYHTNNTLYQLHITLHIKHIT